MGGDPSPARRAEVAYLELVRRYESSILNYVYRLIGDRQTAEDLTQDTFLKAYRAVDRMGVEDADDPRRRAWLYRIARNTVTDHLRRQRRLQWLPLEAIRWRDGSAPEPEVVAAEPVQVALAGLTADQREVLYLFAVVGLSADQVGEVLRLTPAAARKRLQRAREAFERAYSPEAS